MTIFSSVKYLVKHYFYIPLVIVKDFWFPIIQFTLGIGYWIIIFNTVFYVFFNLFNIETTKSMYLKLKIH